MNSSLCFPSLHKILHRKFLYLRQPEVLSSSLICLVVSEKQWVFMNFHPLILLFLPSLSLFVGSVGTRSGRQQTEDEDEEREREKRQWKQETNGFVGASQPLRSIPSLPTLSSLGRWPVLVFPRGNGEWGNKRKRVVEGRKNCTWSMSQVRKEERMWK